jgi:hypothetical protein
MMSLQRIKYYISDYYVSMLCVRVQYKDDEHNITVSSTDIERCVEFRGNGYLVVSMALQSLRRQDTMLTSMNGHSGSTRRFNSSKRSSSTSKRSYCEYTAMKDKENQR